MNSGAGILSFSQLLTEEPMANQASFLYDYYGMTEETRLDPPSPGHPGMREKILPVSPFQSTSNSSITSDDEIIQRSPYNFMQKTVFSPQEKYIFILEAKTSIVQKKGSEALTYLNKGQFYYLVFEAQASKLTRVKTVINLVFGNENDPLLELAYWEHWYNQQPNPNQRGFDIDLKACHMIDEEIEEIGYNAVAFTWNPNIRAKVSIRINCLSTDFCSQKGVKGIPLILQVDTYEDLLPNAELVHRAFGQIKVFRGKGAERKNKDESKILGKKMGKTLDSGDSASDLSNVFQIANKVTVLFAATNFTKKSVVFSPDKDKTLSPRKEIPTTPTIEHSPPNSNPFINALKECENKRAFTTVLASSKDTIENSDVLHRPKAPRVIRKKEPAVTIYVRKEEEKAYNALILETPTLDELKTEISRKYCMPVDMIKHVFKKTKKGILVNMDDRLVEQFDHEDDFTININFDNPLGHFELILNC